MGALNPNLATRDRCCANAATVTFGGLKDEIAYTDDAFGIDPDIQEMFYGDAAS